VGKIWLGLDSHTLISNISTSSILEGIIPSITPNHKENTLHHLWMRTRYSGCHDKKKSYRPMWNVADSPQRHWPGTCLLTFQRARSFISYPCVFSLLTNIRS
jgi:hypothetical protein